MSSSSVDAKERRPVCHAAVGRFSTHFSQLNLGCWAVASTMGPRRTGRDAVTDSSLGGLGWDESRRSCLA